MFCRVCREARTGIERKADPQPVAQTAPETITAQETHTTPSTITGSFEELVWADEFDGSEVNREEWIFETGAGGWGNNELQNYTDGDNVEVSNGTLKITARQEKPGNDIGNFTSTRMRTKSSWKMAVLKSLQRFQQTLAMVSGPRSGCSRTPSQTYRGRNVVKSTSWNM